MVSHISESCIPIQQTKSTSLTCIKQFFYQNYFFFLLIPSIPPTTLLNTVSEMLIQISPSIALPFLSYTPLEVLWALLGRAFRNLIRSGPAWSGDWARWPPEVLSSVKYSMIILTLITQWVYMLQPSFHLLELELKWQFCSFWTLSLVLSLWVWSVHTDTHTQKALCSCVHEL